ncbi:DUF5134 domain-containing protein [Amycolatopsis sp. NPDC051903]|uniref:DUF5134 domain-containing protein n=1 Tax=Amycolatopsis sp. NPDC051903 TaxID=3363936 RepID=UPI0037A331E6
MIRDLLLRWVVTAVFVLCATERGYGIVIGRLSRTDLVGHGLHALMALAMGVMAWPGGAALPAAGPFLFFLLAALWFIAITLGQAEHRRANGYHAVMMLATAWMYATMSGILLQAPVEAAGRHDSPSMPGMDLPAMAAPGTSPFISGLNWLCAIGFAVAGAAWLWWLFVRRRTAPPPPGRVQVGIAAQAVSAVGMAAMFAVLP